MLFPVLLLAPSAAKSQGQSLTLQQAIEIAQRQGYAARAATRARDAARWRDRAFDARLLPQLSLAGEMPNLNRSIIPVLLPDGTTSFVPQKQTQSSLNLRMAQRLPFTGGNLAVSSGLTRVDLYGEQTSRKWTSSPVVVELRQDLFRPNALSWDTREQDLRATVAERQFLESHEDVAIATAERFFELYIARTVLQNAINNAAVNDTLYNLNKGRYEVGKIGENDLLQSELALLRVRTSLEGAKLEHDRALAALKLALNVPLETPIDIVAPVDVPTVEADTAVAITQALRNRSQMRELDLQSVQARRRLSEARLTTGFGATVTATAGLNQTAPVFDEAYRSLLEQQRFALAVEMPILQWGGRRAQVEAARAEQDRLVHNSRYGREATAQEAHFAALQLGQSQRQLALSAKADTVAAKRFEVAKNRYLIGRIGMDNLYLAQNEKDQALQAYVQSLRGYWLAYYRLRRLTLFDFATGQPIRE